MNGKSEVRKLEKTIQYFKRINTTRSRIEAFSIVHGLSEPLKSNHQDLIERVTDTIDQSMIRLKVSVNATIRADSEVDIDQFINDACASLCRTVWEEVVYLHIKNAFSGYFEKSGFNLVADYSAHQSLELSDHKINRYIFSEEVA